VSNRNPPKTKNECQQGYQYMQQSIKISDDCQEQFHPQICLRKNFGLFENELKRKKAAGDLAVVYGWSRKLAGRAWKVRKCGDLTVFSLVRGGVRRLMAANFCCERLCPLCMHRRSVRVFEQMTRVLNWLDGQAAKVGRTRYRYLLLTLTVKNCEGEALKDSIDHLMHSWNKFNQRKPFKKAVKGYFRAFEVTRNDKTGEYHPHFHLLLAVNPSYFKGDGYIKQSEWVRLWREAAKLDYDPIVDIRPIKENKRFGEVAEVTKYTVKSKDYIHPDLEKSVPIVETLHGALFGRRLYFFGGVFAEARKALKLEDPEKNLTDGEEVKLRQECIVALEYFRFDHGLDDWVLKKTVLTPDGVNGRDISLKAMADMALEDVKAGGSMKKYENIVQAMRPAALDAFANAVVEDENGEVQE